MCSYNQQRKLIPHGEKDCEASGGTYCDSGYKRKRGKYNDQNDIED